MIASSTEGFSGFEFSSVMVVCEAVQCGFWNWRRSVWVHIDESCCGFRFVAAVTRSSFSSIGCFLQCVALGFGFWGMCVHRYSAGGRCAKVFFK